MQTQVLATTPQGTTVVGWLHRAPKQSDTVVLLVPGHNSNGSEGRFIELAHACTHHGLDCLRYDITREKLGENEWRVSTIPEEAAQAIALASKLRGKYRRVVALGHSLGGVACLHLAAAGLVDAIVFLFSVQRLPYHRDHKLASLGVTLDALRSKPVTYANYTGATMVYDAAFFEEYDRTDLDALRAAWQGPSLYLAGTRDRTVTEDEVREGFEKAHEPKALVLLESEHRFEKSLTPHLAKILAGWIAEVAP